MALDKQDWIKIGAGTAAGILLGKTVLKKTKIPGLGGTTTRKKSTAKKKPTSRKKK